jgi:lipoprotein-releasing system ATP-binding protein
MSKKEIVRTISLGKDYPLPQGSLCVFDQLSFTLTQGELVAIMGSSGVGKTTFLNLLGLLDRPTRGKVLIEGEDVSSLTERERALLRNRKIGFIFQFYHLLPEFTTLENVMFPLLIQGEKVIEAREKARRILEKVALADKLSQRPAQLSGGEQQRVAIARALVADPLLLLADEPTGNLDWSTGQRILSLIQSLHQEKGLSSIIVTHDEKVARFCQKIYLLEDGQMKLITVQASYDIDEKK